MATSADVEVYTAVRTSNQTSVTLTTIKSPTTGFDILLLFYEAANLVSILWNAIPQVLRSTNYTTRQYTCPESNQVIYSRNSPSITKDEHGNLEIWTLGSYDAYSDQPTRPVSCTRDQFELLVSNLILLTESFNPNRVKTLKETKSLLNPQQAQIGNTLPSTSATHDVLVDTDTQITYYQGHPAIIDPHALAFRRISNRHIDNYINIHELTSEALKFVATQKESSLDHVRNWVKVFAAERTINAENTNSPVVLDFTLSQRFSLDDEGGVLSEVSVFDYLKEHGPTFNSRVHLYHEVISNAILAIEETNTRPGNTKETPTPIVILTMDLGFSLVPMQEELREFTRTLSDVNTHLASQAHTLYHMVTELHAIEIFNLDMNGSPLEPSIDDLFGEGIQEEHEPTEDGV